MSRVDIDWNLDGFRELRTDPGVVADLDARAQRIQAAAEGQGGSYKTFGSESGGRGRYRAGVLTADLTAILNSQRRDSLLRSLDAGRG